MRNLDQLNNYRDIGPKVIELYGNTGNDSSGVFNIPIKTHEYCLRIIASRGMGWEHVSVSLPDRCPTWEEMCLVKLLFFGPKETVMQLHVPDEDNISYQQYCLHLWKPIHKTIPRPPTILVGPKVGGDNK
jgi:hypothetical protein